MRGGFLFQEVGMKKRVLVAALIGLLPAAAQADDISALKQQVAVLQQSLRSMQQASLEKGVQSAEGTANLERVRREFQSLQGSFDAIQFKLQTMQESLNRYQQDADARLRTIEEQLQMMRKQGTVPAAPAGKPSALLDGPDEGALYQKGLSQIRDGNYGQAATAFKEMLQKHPKGTFAGNAQYWLAECYYAQREYQRAIKEYQAVITNHPRLDKIASAKLKQGMAFADLGMTNEATLFLKKVVVENPGTPEAQKAQDRLRILSRSVAPSGGGSAPATRPLPSNDAIPLAPGAIKPKAELTPAPLNETSTSTAGRH
jgi:tol-pal system protein YbgF